MSELLDKLKAKYPHYKILSEPDSECGCKGAGERWVKPSEFWPEGRHTPCLCICLSGEGRAECVQVFGKAAKKVADELRDGRTCNCADPENCKQAVPGYICKAGRTIWQDDSQSDRASKP